MVWWGGNEAQEFSFAGCILEPFTLFLKSNDTTSILRYKRDNMDC